MALGIRAVCKVITSSVRQRTIMHSTSPMIALLWQVASQHHSGRSVFFTMANVHPG